MIVLPVTFLTTKDVRSLTYTPESMFSFKSKLVLGSLDNKSRISVIGEGFVIHLICKLFMQKYFSHAAGVFVYGDPSGNSEDTRSEKGQNDYRIILTSLAALRPQSRVHRKAPSVAMRGNFINAIFEHEFDGISININEKCVNSISDFSYLKEDSDGTKYKQKVKDDETKVTYEKYGHCSDAFDYMITVAFAESYAKFQSGGSLKSLNFGKNAVSKNRY